MMYFVASFQGRMICMVYFVIVESMPIYIYYVQLTLLYVCYVNVMIDSLPGMGITLLHVALWSRDK